VSDPAERDVVFLIADLAGYTALTEAHGGTEAAKVVHRYVDLAERALRPDVHIVERVGDELLIVGREPDAVVETALALHGAIEAEALFPSVRMGIHAGRVVEEAGRYYGTPLNAAARLAGHARPGQILCSDSIAGADGVRAKTSCRRLGPVAFKNLPAPITVFEVASRPPSAEPAVDPVCQMQISPDTAPARLPYRDRVHLFCSFECARAFATGPDRYLGTG
jgi:class 3 adenylate cyclase/YHS domain-containing protein